jgi:hypothetical protein
MPIPTRSYILAVLAVMFLVPVMTTSGRASSGEATPVLVELFTSEGCSSCPPADTFLRSLDGDQSLPGVRFIVLEEHVDYWDDLGWRDPFSSHDLTLRQANYARRMSAMGPYTPEMVVDGAYEFTGSDRTRAGSAFDKVRLLPTVSVKISSIKVETGKLLAHVETGVFSERVEVFAAVALEHAVSQVQHGENGGHRLEHVAVVKSLTRIGSTEAARSYSGNVNLDVRSLSQAGRLVVFLQEPGQGKILGAAVEKFQP